MPIKYAGLLIVQSVMSRMSTELHKSSVSISLKAECETVMQKETNVM